MNNNQNNNNQNIKKGNKTIKKNREEAKASIMNLEKLKMEYSLQLNAYKQAIADYINYLQQNAQTPCNNLCIYFRKCQNIFYPSFFLYQQEFSLPH